MNPWTMMRDVLRRIRAEPLASIGVAFAYLAALVGSLVVLNIPVILMWLFGAWR